MRVLNLVVGVLLVLLATTFFWFIYSLAVNIPYIDDYAFFDYTLRLIDAPSIGEFWKVLWAQHGGHRIVLTKLSFLIQYLLTGEINYRQKILIETFFIWSFFWLFWYVFRKNSIPFFYLLPVGFILFSPIYYQDIFWNMTAWQHAGSTLLITLCFYFLCLSRRHSFLIALLFGVMVTFNNGNGWLSLFIGGGLLLLQKRNKRAVIWLIFCAVLSLVHLTDSAQELHGTFSAKYFFQTLCVFLGSIFFFVRGNQSDNFYGGLGLLGAGLLLMILLLSVYLKLVRNNKLAITISHKITSHAINLAILGLTACMIFTAIGAGLLRQSKGFVVWPHYMIYSVFTALCIYALTIVLLPNKYRMMAGVSGVLFSMLIEIGGILFAFPDAVVFRKQLISDAFKLKNEKVNKKPLTYINPISIGKSRYSEMVARGMYHLPSTPLDELSAQVFGEIIDTSLTPNVDMLLQIQTETGSGRTIGLSNQKLFAGGSHSVYVLLKNKEEVYLIAPKPGLLSNRRTLLRSGKIYQDGFSIDLFRTNYTSGNYQLGLILPIDKGFRVVYTSQQITIKNPDPGKD